jgi:hypothetical protein
MNTPSESADIVLVPVPRAHLGAVYAALAKAMANKDEEAASVLRPAAANEVLVDRRNGSWTEEMVRLLQADLHYEGAWAVLDICSERAPAEVTVEDVAKEAGIKATEIRAQLGAMTKLSNRLFNRKTWPISVRWTDGGRANYSMKPEIATWWSRAVTDSARVQGS